MFDLHQNIQDPELSRKLEAHPQMQEMEREHKLIQKAPYAPRYHYYSIAPSRKLNDPNGLCVKDGVYHMFYQQWPQKGSVLHWGHAISRDFVRWTELPTAISPGKETHVFSGSVLLEDSRALAIYHGVGQGNMIAQSTDEYLVNWQKISEDAVIPSVPYDENGYPYRVFDPCIWKEEDGYYALSGTFKGPQPKLIRGKHSMMPHLFHSTDLYNWTYVCEFMPHNPFYFQGEDCACPYFLPFGDRWMLMHFSHTSSSHILIGDYNREKHIFIPTAHQALASGEISRCAGGLGAGSAATDGNGGVYAIFNVKDGQIMPEGHDGMMLLPWHITLENGELRIRPHMGVDTLHKSCHEMQLDLPANAPQLLKDVGNSVEIEMELDMKQARAAVVRVLCSEDGREHTDITVTRRLEDRAHPIGSYPYLPDQTARVYLTLDSIHASLAKNLWPRAAETLDTAIPLDDPIRLRIFLDVCTVEVFLNDRLVLSQSVYPTAEDSRNVIVEAIGCDAVAKMKIWDMEQVI